MTSLFCAVVQAAQPTGEASDLQFWPPCVVFCLGNMFSRMKPRIRWILMGVGSFWIAAQRIVGVIQEWETALQVLAVIIGVGTKFGVDAYVHSLDGPVPDRLSDWGGFRVVLDPLFPLRYEWRIWNSPRSRRWLLQNAWPLPRCLSRPSSEWEGGP